MHTHRIQIIAAIALAVCVAGQVSGAEGLPGEGSIVLDGKLFCSLERQVMLPFEGVISEVNVRCGQPVTKGYVLVEYRLPPDVACNLARRFAAPHVMDLEVRAAEAERTLISVERSLEDARQLAAQGMASTQRIEQAERDVELAERRRDSIEARLTMERSLVREERASLSNLLGQAMGPDRVQDVLSLTAPLDGTVIWMHEMLREGARLRRDEPVVLIGVIDPMVMKAQVYEDEIVQLEEGDAARATVASMPGRAFDAALSHVSWSPLASELERPSFYEVEFTVPNPDGALRPGFKGQIVVGEAR